MSAAVGRVLERLFMGLMPLLAGLLAAAVSGAPHAKGSGQGCIAADPADPRLCIRSTPRPMSPYRLSPDLLAENDLKMDAIHVNPRPCRLVGHLDCPGKGRPVLRSNGRNWLNLRPVNPFAPR